MRFVILGLLLSGPQSLYGLRKHFTAGVAHFYSGSIGGLRRALSQLESAGWVTVQDAADPRRGKREYTVTDDGRAAWRAWMISPVPASADSETVILARVFLLGWLSPGDRQLTLQALQARVDEDSRALVAVRDSLDPAAGNSTEMGFPLATLEYGLRAHRLLADWIGEVARDPASTLPLQHG